MDSLALHSLAHPVRVFLWGRRNINERSGIIHRLACVVIVVGQCWGRGSRISKAEWRRNGGSRCGVEGHIVGKKISSYMANAAQYATQDEVARLDVVEVVRARVGRWRKVKERYMGKGVNKTFINANRSTARWVGVSDGLGRIGCRSGA